MVEDIENSTYDEGLFTYDEWINAHMLLEAEINRIDKNKHFNTINLQYYNSLSTEYRNNILNKDYFECYIKNYLFYGLEEEVFNYIYYIPKNPYSFRKISYNSYVARLIHYGIGLYLYKVTENFENEFISQNDSIKSWYGGKIKYTSLNTVSINKENLYYKDSYKAFSRELIKISKENKRNRIVIKLDIQDFYDNIYVENFLKKLKETLNYSTRNAFCFDDIKIKCISDFYHFIMSGKEGIPQSDNDIISSFISNIYMKLVDIEILKCIKDMQITKLKEYRIVQYCDDTYIILDFEDDENNDNIYIDVRKILQKISLILINEFNIKFNSKSQIFNFSIEQEIEKFMKCIKINSQEEMELAKGEKPQLIFENIIEELNRVNNLDSSEINIDDSIEVFKKIYNDSIKNIINKPDNLILLEKTIEELDFNKIFLSSKYVVTLACKNINTRKKLLEYIENGFENNLSKLFLALEYIAKEDIEYRKNILQMTENETYKKILEFKVLNNDTGGYINLEKDEIKKLNIFDKSLIINQIKCRRIAENSLNYNIAFNHLVNEIKSIANHIYSPETEEKEYNAQRIKSDLIRNGCSLRITLQICNMFDRRNNNTISHSNGEIVTKDEYYKNKKYVEELLKEIINNMES